METILLKKVQQRFDSTRIDDIETAVIDELLTSDLKIKPGARIAIATGSRGVSNIAIIVRTVAKYLKSLGASPFIIPAMGSHGGATATGQREVLESYGVTESYCGIPIQSSMEVVELPQGDLKNKVFMDKYAYLSDGVIVINRIKPHTDFHGPLESGLMKMCVIGLGKHKQALAIHRFGVYGLRELITPTAQQVLKTGKIILGIGLVENAYDETMIIRAVKPDVMEEEEKKLLNIARNHMPSLPVKKLDILIVDQMGKDISGVGIDTNIIGRIAIKGESDSATPDITTIIATDLTEASHGNALGMGLADIITKKLYNKIEFQATYENVITSTFLERGKMPIVAKTDLQALQYSLRTSGPIAVKDARIIRIKNTLHLGEMYVSKPVWDEISTDDSIEELSDYVPLMEADKSFISF